ncbi:MAG: sigma 54-interacting transcriptional regulator [Eubacteriales bacterium]|nr:sigma 54-interacting transcriptional regulator [Eubacteriales bacterium]MDD4583513.1 sigma 54-interacting transcriptional regulator [Eubacteriales bacterium]
MKVKDYKRITQEVFRLVEEGVHVIDMNEETIIYNESMANLEKMNRNDVLKKPFRQIFNSIEEERSTLLQALRKGKITANVQQTYCNKDGKEITTINSTYPVIEGDRIIGAIEIARNITEIQKMCHTIMKLQKATLEPTDVKDHKIKKYHFENLIGQNEEFVETVNRAKKAAKSNVAVLIYGETGTGKELVAQSIHYDGNRREKPFLAQNCAALPESLLEGILFGTSKGGFTGAMDRAGLFEQADGGTLLLDEISAMPYELQGKLLRVLQEDYIRRVGGSKDIPIDVRIIATINEPVDYLIKKGKLRKDLYYRLSIIFIDMPPLRKRQDDIMLLAEKFLDKHNRLNGKEVWMLSEKAKEKLLDHDYPGNVRELENIIMAGVSMIEDEHVLTDEHISIVKTKEESFGSHAKAMEMGLDRYMDLIEKQIINETMVANNGNISRTAEQLSIKRQTLQHKLKKR